MNKLIRILDSDVSEQSRKTYNNVSNGNKLLRERTSLMLQGKSKISSTLSYTKLLNKSREGPSILKHKDSAFEDLQKK